MWAHVCSSGRRRCWSHKAHTLCTSDQWVHRKVWMLTRTAQISPLNLWYVGFSIPTAHRYIVICPQETPTLKKGQFFCVKYLFCVQIFSCFCTAKDNQQLPLYEKNTSFFFVTEVIQRFLDPKETRKSKL